jgi:hypothetical protein
MEEKEANTGHGDRKGQETNPAVTQKQLGWMSRAIVCILSETAGRKILIPSWPRPSQGETGHWDIKARAVSRQREPASVCRTSAALL